MRVGEFLKNKRENNNISIRELSFATKIREAQLKQLEENDLSQLPSKAYLIGFIKNISDVLEVDSAEALNLLEMEYTDIERKDQKVEVLNLRPQHLSLDFDNNLLKMKYTSLVGIVFSIFAIVFAVSIFNGHHNLDEVTSARVVAIPKNKIATIIKTPNNIEKKKETIVIPVTLPNTVRVKAINGDCWIAYKVDDQSIVQFVLEKDKEVIMRGDVIKLRVANYKLVEISHNDKQVSVNNRSLSLVTNLIFPEKLKEELKAPYLSFAEDKIDSSKTPKKEISKDI